MMKQGIILKGIGSFYTVLSNDGEQYTLKARGKFRNKRIKPLIGDNVLFSDDTIDDILERKNAFVRPAVANITKLMLVLSATVPKADLMLLDKLLLQCEKNGIEPVIILNKWECRDEEYSDDIIAQYEQTGYPIIKASAYEGIGVDEIIAHIKDNICCFAGQSAVGKSSLLNKIAPSLNLETGGLSKKTDRGKHTTRHGELFVLHGGMVMDTPGFSLLDTADMEPCELAALYPEMRKAMGECRFAECLHIHEPDCKVKELLSRGKISQERYKRYNLLLDELKEKRRHMYD